MLDHCNFASSFQSPAYFQVRKLLVNIDSSPSRSEQERTLIHMKRQAACCEKLQARLLLRFMLLHQVATYTTALNNCQQKRCSQADLSVRGAGVPVGMGVKRTKEINEVMKSKYPGFSDIKRHLSLFWDTPFC